MYGRRVSPWDYQTQLEQRLAQMQGQGQPQGNRYAGGSSETTAPQQQQAPAINPIDAFNFADKHTGLSGYMGAQINPYATSGDIPMAAYESGLVGGNPADYGGEMAGFYTPEVGVPLNGTAPVSAAAESMAPLSVSPSSMAPLSMSPSGAGLLGAEAATSGLLGASGLAVAPSGTAMAAGMAPLSMAPGMVAPAAAAPAAAGAAGGATTAASLGALGPIGLGIGGIFALGSLLDWW